MAEQFVSTSLSKLKMKRSSDVAGTLSEMCVTSISVDSTFDTVDGTCLNSTTKVEVPTFHNFGISFDYNVMSSDVNGNALMGDLRAVNFASGAGDATATMDWELFPIGEGTGKYKFSGVGYISENNESISGGEIVRGSAKISNKGTVVLTEPLP